MYKTQQEQLWATEFGEAYISRNQASTQAIADRTAMFARILQRAGEIGSVLELGANIGINLHALRNILPEAEFATVEINPAAAEVLRRIPGLTTINQSLLEFTAPRRYDLVFTSGVLIHINPEHLPTAYDRMYESSSRYVCIAEYYNPSPVELEYRGAKAALFKRDFAGEMLERHPDLRLLDYGFIYHRDLRGVDDLTWFLMERP